MAGVSPTPPGRDAVRWLEPDEQRAWHSLIALLAEIREEQDEALADTHGLSEGEYGVLASLSEAPGHRLRMCDLAQQLRMSPSGLTRRIDGMVRHGWVLREPSVEDRRVMLAVLTDDGMAKLEAAAPTHVAAVRSSLIDHLTPEDLRTLTEVIGRARASRGDLAG
jgi:DNA-binding MarR family transcriptional regulator